MELETRRSFNQTMLHSLLAYGLIESVAASNLFAAAVKPVVSKWLHELAELSQDLKGHKLKDVDFQAKLEVLYKRVNLDELIGFIDLDHLAEKVKYPTRGAASVGLDLSKVEGLPARLVMGVALYPFEAHAWTECGDRIVGDDRARCAQFAPVSVYE